MQRLDCELAEADQMAGSYPGVRGGGARSDRRGRLKLVSSTEPTARQLKALQAAKELEEGRSVHINLGAAEECCDLRWLQAYNGGYLLTEGGRAALRRHTL
jgi:hypothetical protein